MYHNIQTIPTDGLEVSRRMMAISSDMLNTETRAAIFSETDVPNEAIRALRLGVSLIEAIEYAEKKLEHPILSAYRAGELINPVNRTIQTEKGGLSRSAVRVNLGEAQIDDSEVGKISIGFAIDPDSVEKFEEERPEAIDIVLDMAGLHPDDDFRKWRIEEGNFWVPVFEVITGDTPVDELIGDVLLENLSDRFFGEPVDLFNAKARVEDIDLPKDVVEQYLR